MDTLLNPWSRILDEAQEHHEVQLDALVDEYKRNGDSENVAHLKAQNALLPLYRKELRKVLLEYLQWMRAMKKDYTFQKVMETQKVLKDTDEFDWLESTELAIDKRKFLVNRMFVEQPIPQDEGLDLLCFVLNTKCISNRYLACCSIGVYFFVKRTSVLLFIAS